MDWSFTGGLFVSPHIALLNIFASVAEGLVVGIIFWALTLPWRR